MPKDNPAKKSNVLIPILIVVGLVFLVFLFYQFNKSKPELAAQSQPDPEASNSADFNQQDRLEATGASVAKTSENDIQVEIFGRETCSHCMVVAAYLDKEPHVLAQISKRWLDDGQNDSQDRNELNTATEDCQIPGDQVGVPLMHLSGADAPSNPADRCLMGDTPIIEYLNTNLK